MPWVAPLPQTTSVSLPPFNSTSDSHPGTHSEFHQSAQSNLSRHTLDPPLGLDCETHHTTTSFVIPCVTTTHDDIDIDSALGDDVDDEWDDADLVSMVSELRSSRRRRKSSPSPHDSSTSLPPAIPLPVLEASELFRRLLPPGNPFPLTSLYASLGVTSFSDLLTSARRFAPFHPMKRAAEAARSWVVDNPSDRISLAKVDEDTKIVQEHGILHLLNRNLVSLKASSVQPNIALAPPISSDRRLVPPYPSHQRMQVVHDLADGGHLPSGPCEERLPIPSPRPPRPSDEEIAIERLLASDHRGGQALIIDYDVGIRAFAAAGSSVRLTSDHIAAKALAPEGRLVLDYTSSGVNSRAFKPFLASKYGDIVDDLPALHDYCSLAMSSINYWPNEYIVISKSDCHSWHRRVHVRPSNVSQLAWVIYIQGRRYLVLPTANQFGSQSSCYESSALTAVIAANDRFDDIQYLGRPCSLMYCDDDVAILPDRLVTERRARHESRVREVTGSITLNPKKNSDGPIQDVIGFQIDIPHRRVSLALHRLLKMCHHLFESLPLDVTVGSRVRVSLLQALASYMMQASALVVVGRPFCFSLYRNTSRVPTGQSHVSLTRASLVDINVWRGILLFAWHDARCLVLPLSVPPLLHHPRDETWLQWSHRMEDQALIVINGDSAGRGWSISNTFGLGFTARVRASGRPFLSEVLWGQFQVPYFDLYLHDRASNESDNNFYELLAAVVALDAVCQRLPQWRADSVIVPDPTTTITTTTTDTSPVHIHVWSDSISALAWLRRHKADSPLHAFASQIFTFLQVRHNVILTSGHVEGSHNLLGDGPSRNFPGPNGAQTRALLSSVPKTLQLPPWLESMRTIGSHSSSTILRDAVRALTPLV